MTVSIPAPTSQRPHPGTAVQHVIPVPAIQRVIPIVAKQLVVPVLPGQYIVVAAAGHLVVQRIAIGPDGIGHVGQFEVFNIGNHIDAVCGNDSVNPAIRSLDDSNATLDHVSVVPVTADQQDPLSCRSACHARRRQLILAIAAEQVIVSAVTVQNVLAAFAADGVISNPTAQRIVAAAASTSASVLRSVT